MFSFHKPRVYRSTEGCCICRAKSSSSRFTDSKKYEDDSMKCFNLEKARQGEICNACVLLVKRFKRLPAGSNRHWGHVVDARIGPGMKSLTKFKKQREDTQQNSSENVKVQNSKPSTSSIPEKFCKIFKKNKTKKQLKNEKIKEKREGSPNSWDEQSLPPTPESLNSEDDVSSSINLSNNRANKSSTNRIDRRKMLKPRKNMRKFSNIKFFDEQEWKRLNSCCGTVYENVNISALMIDADTYRPCAYHHLRQQLITTNPPVTNSLPATSYSSANIEIDKLWRISKKNTTLIHELNRKMHLEATVNVVKDENTVQTPALKKHHLFFKRQLENFPAGDISTSNTVKTDLDSSSTKKTDDNNDVQSKDTTSKLRSTLLHKLKSDTGKIVKHSLEKINTLRVKQADLNDIKNLIKITDKTPKPRNVEDSANVQCNLKSEQPANKFNDNSSDSGFDENLQDRKSVSPMQQEDEDKDKKALVRAAQGMFVANGTPIQSQPQNAIMSSGDAVTKRVQPRRQYNGLFELRNH